MAQLVVKVTEQGIDSTDKKLAKLGKTSDGTENSTSKLGKSSVITAKSIAGVGAAAVTAVAGVSAYTIQLARAVTETDNLARASGLTREEFQQSAFAAEQYGLTVNQLGDAFRDTEERIGEFIATGGGGLQDFGDVMGMTEEEVLSFAESVQDLSGQDALQLMVTRMEEAGKSTEEMSFALEGMGSELTYILPLLEDGGREMERLNNRMDEFTNPLSDEDVQSYRDLNESVALAEAAFISMAENGLAPVAELLSDAADGMTEFFASYNEGTIAFTNRQLEETANQIAAIETILANNPEPSFFGLSAEEIERQRDRLAELRAELALLQGQSRAQNQPGEGDAGFIGPIFQSTSPTRATATTGTSAPSVTGVTQDQTDAELQMVIDSLKTQEELLADSLERRTAIVANSSLSEQEQADLNIAIWEDYYDKLGRLSETTTEKQAEDSAEATGITMEQGNAALSFIEQNTKRGSDLNKAAAITQATIATYTAATEAYKATVGIPYIGPYLAPAAAGAAVAFGMSNVQSIQSARAQGGQVYAGQAYTVGEEGRETFIPSSNGNIVPGDVGGSATQVNIYNQAGDTQVTSQPNESGGTDIYITRRELPGLLAAEMGNPNSKANKSLNSTYQLQRS